MIDTMARAAESNRIDEIRAWKRKRVIEMVGRRRSCPFPFRLLSSRAFEQLPKLWQKIDGRTHVARKTKKWIRIRDEFLRLYFRFTLRTKHAERWQTFNTN